MACNHEFVDDVLNVHSQGVGYKRATELIKKFGSIEEI